MPLDLAQLQRGTARVSVRYAGETFGVDCRPHAYTSGVHRRLQAAVASGQELESFDVLTDTLLDLLSGWDVTEKGALLPVDRETLSRFPLAMLTAIAGAVMEYIADPNRPAPTADQILTSSGSSATVRLVGAQTGMAS